MNFLHSDFSAEVNTESIPCFLILWVLFSLIVFAFLINGNYSDWENAKDLSRELAVNHCQNVTKQIAAQIENVFLEKSNKLAILAALWRYCPENDRQSRFLLDANRIINQESSFRIIDYVDLSGQIKYSSDFEKSISNPPHSRSEMLSILHHMENYRLPLCASPIEYDNGNIEVRLFYPIFIDGEENPVLHGGIAATVVIQELLKIMMVYDQNDFYVVSRVNGIRVKNPGDKESPYLEESMATTRIDIFGNEWNIDVYLRASSKTALLYNDNLLRFLINVSISTIISALLALLFYVIARIRKSRQDLRESECRFRQLADHIQEVFWLYDLRLKRMIYTSPAYNRIWGRSIENLYQNPSDWLVSVHPDDLQSVSSIFHSKINREFFDQEYRIIRPSGETRWIHSRGFPVVDDGGNVFRIAGVAEDVTESKEAEVALRASEKILRQILDLVPHMIFAKDESGKILLANRAFASAYGKTIEQITNQHHKDIHANEEEVERYLLDDLLVFQKNQPTFIARETFTDILGSVRIHQTTRIPFLLPHSEEPAVLGISIDITKQEETERQQIKLEEQLRQSQKMEAIGQLAGGVAHDFNNLLTGIIGYSNLVLRSLPKEELLYKNVSEIQKAGERAASLVRQLLAFSRKQILEPKIHCLSDLVSSMEEMLRRMIGENIEFSIKSDPSRGHVKADPAQMTQIIMNLVVNARDAMPEGGKLSIETSTLSIDGGDGAVHFDVSSGSYVMLVVSDNGCGMDEKTLGQIYEPFFTTKEQGKGTGLGLSTVYGIVKQSGGVIHVSSEPGVGTTFKILFPQVNAFSESHQIQTEPHDSLFGEEVILLVEDDEIVNHMSAHALSEYGYTVLKASDAMEAHDIYNRYDGEIDLLLTDVVLPKESGRALAENLISQQPNLRILYMSGYTTQSIVNHGMLEEGISFLQKPFTADTLIRKVRNTLD